MADSERHIALRAGDHLVCAVLLDHHRAFLEFADAEDCGLRLIDDDRRREEAAADAVIRDGEGAAADVCGLKFPCARGGDAFVEDARNVEERFVFETMEYGDDEPYFGERRCYADVDDVVEFER